MHSTVALAFTSLTLMGIGLLSWALIVVEKNIGNAGEHS
jgi:hypothetical protein